MFLLLTSIFKFEKICAMFNSMKYCRFTTIQKAFENDLTFLKILKNDIDMTIFMGSYGVLV